MREPKFQLFFRHISYSIHMKRIFLTLSVLFVLLRWPFSTFAGNPPDQGKSIISSTSAPADGASSSTVTIVLKDASGNTLTGNDTINLTSSEGSASFSPSSFTLDGSGSLITSMKTTTAGSIQLKLTDVTTSNTQLTWYIPFYQPGTATPTPTPTPNPNACADAPPGSSPKLTSAVSSGAHTITLTWIDASDPVSYYLLTYGLSTGSYIYGNPNIGGQGTISYTVGGLATGTKYYFVIRAGNGCTPGTFSNELSAVAGGSPTPTPTPINTTTTVTSVPIQKNDILPADTPIDTPIPTLEQTPTPLPTGGSSIGTIVMGGTGLGVMIMVGVGIWLYNKHR